MLTNNQNLRHEIIFNEVEIKNKKVENDIRYI